MNLLDIVHRAPTPRPWEEGEKIPWNEPGFSARMLKEHLNQAHDAASRRFEKIDQQVNWIHHEVLGGQPAKILDLGCGPGLYVSRLARLGHACTGIDFSPASIAYAAAAAADDDCAGQNRCNYIQQDIRTAHFGRGYDLIMLIFGEFNVFTRLDACAILRKAHAALAPGGVLLLEPHTQAAIEREGGEPPRWYSAKSGLFSDKPHLCLTETFWDASQQTTTRRYLIIDAASGNVARYAESIQAYSENDYLAMLDNSGFTQVTRFPSLCGEEDSSQAAFFVLLAQKEGEKP